ncbi:MAG: LacI family DNA-binding transcriptional regulator [Chthoniobacteraceae bacterium]
MNSDERTSVTVNDVARAAGVSVGTVSRVLNGFPNVAADNIAKVQKAVEVLNYQKNLSAGLLRSRRSGSRCGSIGLVFVEMGQAWSRHPLFSSYVAGVEQACQENGIHAIVELCSDSSEVPRCVRQRKVDGLLIKTTRGLPGFFDRLPVSLPVVCLGMNDPMSSFYQVAPDNRSAGWMISDYLWQHGHRKIAFLCSEAKHPIFIVRLQGYEGFLRSKGVFDPRLVVMEELTMAGDPEQTPPDMSKALHQVMSLPVEERPTAIVTGNDWAACGLYSAIAKMGLQVPRDISVVGADNDELLCNSMVPPLTSYAAAFTEVAHAGALELIARIEDPERARESAVLLLRGRIVERRSVATQGAGLSDVSLPRG